MEPTQKVTLLEEENAALRREIAALREQLAIHTAPESALDSPPLPADPTAPIQLHTPPDPHAKEQRLHWLQELFARAPIGLVLSSRTGRVIECNEAFADILGYSIEELCTMNIVDFTHPDDIDKQMSLVDEMVHRRRDAYQIDKRYIRHDGEIAWVRLRSSFVYNEAGEIEVAVTTVKEITALREQEQAVQQSKMLLQGVIDNASALIFVKNFDGVILLSNKKYASVLDMTPQEIVGQRDADLFPPEVLDHFRSVERDIQTHGHLVTEECEFHIEGENRTFLCTTFPILDQENEMYAVGGIATDITDQKQAEAERIELQEQIIETQRDSLRELSSPLIPLNDDVLLMPLVGAIDSRRAQQIMEVLLEGVATHTANLAIVDITGVQVVDTQVANALVQTAQAVKLLGAKVVLTGIGPTMAQTLVHLGADLSSIVTQGSLQQGIGYALKRST
jgi:PAS domain S-box-containing protein